ncbi:hypothetical protein LVJ94_17140 [Pendulispora rubella]|uniref:Uncharacterized protein n=1 Tax=Pendulispora rubella TaxID=2741070 RepID=A0ABZ2LDD2_9BACT
MEPEKRTWPPSFGGSPIGKDRVVAAEIGELLERERLCESVAATDSMMQALYPNGIAPEHMADAFGILRILDQMVRIAQRKSTSGESPWRLVASYAILAAVRHEPGFAVSLVDELQARLRYKREKA